MDIIYVDGNGKELTEKEVDEFHKRLEEEI